ncbi:hypothetical protein FIBSPDRAFT_759510 [Athelia psychrophila]|uniref:Uncharacterized protein n=1 Tax=Athelia psychrophila TaxID=1759441 RepID=A0A165YPB2_9AGAM|nr:hypothetical protein FIBSPDRAFT_759510 [Fibularhizoctonia sp. CBS 109695]
MYERFDGDAEGGWDDQLTENELNLMSGVYKIFTGPGVYQEADASWWPKNSTWKTSALDVGYWSPTCEEWYQRRLAGILDGSAKVKSATKWRDALKLHKESSALVKVTRQKCALLLKA